jgi:hypothetical protein
MEMFASTGLIKVIGLQTIQIRVWIEITAEIQTMNLKEYGAG